MMPASLNAARILSSFATPTHPRMPARTHSHKHRDTRPRQQHHRRRKTMPQLSVHAALGLLLSCLLLLLQPAASFFSAPVSSTRATVFARKSVVLKPTLLIQHTAGELSADKKEALVAEASKIVSTTIGKPEKFVMVGLTEATMSFGGKPGNAAFLYLASIGNIGPETNKPAAKELTALVEKHLGITGDRVFIQFNDASASNFAWQGRTFG